MNSLYNMSKQQDIFADIEDELFRADSKYLHDPMSPEEIRSSFLTIKAELAELEREVERVKRRPHLLQKEATQVAAMAVKFIRDVCLAEVKDESTN